MQKNIIWKQFKKGCKYRINRLFCTFIQANNPGPDIAEWTSNCRILNVLTEADCIKEQAKLFSSGNRIIIILLTIIH